MITTVNTFIAAIMLSASTFVNPTAPKALSFDASTYVTVNNQVRLSIQNNGEERLRILFWNKHRNLLFQKVTPKNEDKTGVLFTVSDLADGEYLIEVRSKNGSYLKPITVSTAPVKQVNSRIIAIQ
jgi:hypothetical protein